MSDKEFWLQVVVPLLPFVYALYRDFSAFVKSRVRSSRPNENIAHPKTINHKGESLTDINQANITQSSSKRKKLKAFIWYLLYALISLNLIRTLVTELSSDEPLTRGDLFVILLNSFVLFALIISLYAYNYIKSQMEHSQRMSEISSDFVERLKSVKHNS